MWLLILGCAKKTPSPVPVTTLVVGSCSDQNEDQKHWDILASHNPAAALLIGDNVYADVGVDVDGNFTLVDATPTQIAGSYEQLAAVPSFQRFQNTFRIIAAWDDHDYGKNDAGVEFEHKAASEQIFLDFWQVSDDDPRRQRPGTYGTEWISTPGGRIQVLVLDTRSFRGTLTATDERNAPGKERYVPSESSGQVMLGEAQWTWLEDALREPADLRLLVSSIQVLAEGHGWERWGLLPSEQQRLVDLVAETNAEHLVVLSGDRHLGGLYRKDVGLGYPLIELTTSSLNKSFGASDGPDAPRIGDTFGDENYAVVHVDWSAQVVDLALMDMTTNPVRQLQVPFADLER